MLLLERQVLQGAAGRVAIWAREVLAGNDARTLARELLTRTEEEFGRAFSKSPMKHAKPRSLKRNATAVLGNVGTPDDAAVLTYALTNEQPLGR